MAFINMPRPVFLCQCTNHAWTTLTLGFVTLVSPEDAPLLSKRAWTTKKGRNTFYARTTKTFLHREIMNPSPGSNVDHQNGNGLDNRRSNLRTATTQQNCQNGPAHKDSTSKYRGVSWNKNYNKWRAVIYVAKKQISLGHFRSEEFAAKIYDLAAARHFGEFAWLNFPTDERGRSYEAFDHRVESPSALSWQQLALPFSHDPATNE